MLAPRRKGRDKRSARLELYMVCTPFLKLYLVNFLEQLRGGKGSGSVERLKMCKAFAKVLLLEPLSMFFIIATNVQILTICCKYLY